MSIVDESALGESDFELVRDRGSYYVDKTEYVAKLEKSRSRFFFFTRPRRFGKSLFLSTIEAAYQGKRHLFKDLYLENHWDWNITYPVFKLSLAIEEANFEIFNQSMINSIKRRGRRFGFTEESCSPRDALEGVLFFLNETYSKKVVLLIDEYDAPLTSFINDHKGIEPYLKTLKGIYSCIKDNSELIHKVVFTGITSVARTSIFSGLNNTVDITLDPEFNKLCGYTEKELYSFFPEKMKNVNIQELKNYYNGYSWGSEDTLYNPDAINKFFAKGMTYGPHWLQTSITSYFAEYCRKYKEIADYLVDSKTDTTSLLTAQINNYTPTALLFQNGYLTFDIQRMKEAENNGELEPDEVYLKVPNQIIQKYLFPSLVYTWSSNIDLQNSFARFLRDFPKEFDIHNVTRIKDLLNSVIAHIPYEWFPKRTKNASGEYIVGHEGMYATIIYMALHALPQANIRPEDQSAQGRADVVILYRDIYYLIEHKLIFDHNEAGDALAQLRSRDYARKYRCSGKPIFLIPIEIDPVARSILTLQFVSDT